MRESSGCRVAGTIVLLGATLGVGCSHSPTAPARFGQPNALQTVTGNIQTGATGQVLPVPLTVQVLDAAGRGVPGVMVDWHVFAGGGGLLARAFPTVTDSTGLVFVLWQLGYRLGDQTVAAECCGGGAVFTAHAVLPLAQRVSFVSGVWQRDTVGRTLAFPLVVQVLRADANPDTGVVVGWRTHTPGGHFSSTFDRTDSTGRVSTLWTLGTVAGAETTWAGVRGLPPALVFATALPGRVARVAITPTTLPFLGLIGDTALVSAQAWDQYGNLELGPIPLRASAA
jgi:hypothetical protein